VFRTESEEVAEMGNLEEQIRNVFLEYFNLIESHPEKNPSEKEIHQFGQANSSKLDQIEELFKQRFGLKMAENILISFLEEKSRGIWKAIRYQKEDLGKVTQKETIGRYNDTLTIELEKKKRKVDCFIDFCTKLKLNLEDLDGLIKNIFTTLDNLLKMRMIYKSLYAGELDWKFEIETSPELIDLIKDFFDRSIELYLSELHGVDYSKKKTELDMNSDAFFIDYLTYYKIFKNFNEHLNEVIYSENQRNLVDNQDENGLNLLQKLIFFVCHMLLIQINDIKNQIDMAYQFPNLKNNVYNFGIFMIKELEAFFHISTKFFNFKMKRETSKSREIMGIFLESYLEFKIQFAELIGNNWLNEDNDIKSRLSLYEYHGLCFSEQEAFEKALDLNDLNCIFSLFIHSDIDFKNLNDICEEDEDLKKLFISSAKNKIKEEETTFKIKKKCLQILRMNKTKIIKQNESPIHHIYKEMKKMQTSILTGDDDQMPVVTDLHNRPIQTNEQKLALLRLRYTEMVNDSKISKNLEELMSQMLNNEKLRENDKLEFSACILKALKKINDFQTNGRRTFSIFEEYFSKLRDNPDSCMNDQEKESFEEIVKDFQIRD
jgi:hypothetical protein